MDDPNLTYICMRNFSMCSEEDVIAFYRQSDVDMGFKTIYICDLFFEPDQLPGDSDDTVSPSGALLHELAHLAGADREGYGYTEVRRIATTIPWVSFLFADAYRYYVLNTKNQ